MWDKINQLTLVSYSLFGLPWVLVSLVFALQQPGASVPTQITFWLAILVAFFSARTVGMSLNRLIDYEIDGKNPRTSKRPLQIKLVSPKEVKGLVVTCSLFFVGSCYFLSSLCFYLSPILLGQLYLYSYTKRFSSFCHFFLGSIHFFLPIFAWAAVVGTLSFIPVLLGSALFLLIAASDMMYAVQDIEFDREVGLKSVPATLGVQGTFWIVRLCHLVAIALLVSLGVILGFNLIYFIGIGGIALLFCYYHQNQVESEVAFEACNLWGGIILLLATLGSVL